MIDDVIRTRRTHKSFGPQPVSREVVAELFELARWAPNHHRTNPWRFRLVGPDSLAQHEVVCPHCNKPFTAELLPGSAERYRGFKCPHCKLFVPAERANGQA